MPYQSLGDLFVSQARRYEDRVLYRFSRNGHWQSCTWKEALAEVREIALGLISLGIKKQDRVAILSANRMEWSLIDWANICIGALTVPLYSSSTPSQVATILEHSESQLLFVDSRQRLERGDPYHPSLRKLAAIVLIEPSGQGPAPLPEGGPARVLSLDELREIGRRYGETDEGAFDRAALSLRPEDDLTIIYTSGTTGEPKGVLTTHGHYLFMIEACASAIPSNDDEVTLQFLPFAHSFGRLEHFMVVAKGYTCGFARSMESVGVDLRRVQPTLLFSVPRMYENAHLRILSRIASSGFVRRFLFRWGISVGARFSACQREKRKIPASLRLAHHLATKLIFSNVHRAFGGRLRLAISGGAPLPREVAEFFHALGILILEGYGLTETSTVSHVNRVDRYRIGTVGLPLDGVECRIASDGEILLRGPNVFKGYHRDPAATQTALSADGWFHTGDVGEIDQDGFLRITDRKKDLIVTSGGKKVAPQVIENLLKTDPLISQAMVLGDRSSHLAALITLDQERVVAWGKGIGLELRNPAEAASHPRVQAEVKERVRKINRGLAPFEAVRNFRILPNEFTQGAGELTPTLKLRRQIVTERYREVIEEMTRR